MEDRQLQYEFIREKKERKIYDIIDMLFVYFEQDICFKLRVFDIKLNEEKCFMFVM